MVEALAVLGMNRSGTSSLTGLLQDAGFYLGEVRTRSRYNAKGNRENPVIWELHDEVLAANGGSWNAPPPVPLRWAPDQQKRLDQIVASYRGHEPWAVKDPRMVLTLEAWLEREPGLALVGTFRHPSAVGRSLLERNEMPIPKGLHLWHVYNTRLLEIWEDRPFPIVDFDLPPEAYLDQVTKALSELGCPAERSELSFFEDSLRSSAAGAGAQLPDEIELVYGKLREIAAR